MENRRQNAIVSAYKALGMELPEFADEKGFVGISVFQLAHVSNDNLEIEPDGKIITARPKALAGLEDNNGWIVVNGIDDLPAENMPCHVEYKGHVYLATFYKGFGNRFQATGGQVLFDVDAYRPVVMPPKRIY